MMRKINKLILALLCFGWILLAAWLGYAQDKIPPVPEATNKLRVVVCPISEDRMWRNPHEDYARNQYRSVARFLERTGIYEVVPYEDFKAAAGEDLPGWKLKRQDWTVAKQLARALYADYMVITERGAYTRSTFFWKMSLLNVENGKLFSFDGMVPGGPQADFKPVIQAAYRSIFNEAKGDMFANAVRKGKIPRPGMMKRPSMPVTEPPASEAQQLAASASVSRETEKKPPVVQGAIPQPAPPKIDVPEKSAERTEIAAYQVPRPKTSGQKRKILNRPEGTQPQEPGAADKHRLVVYDLNTSQNLSVVALILTEALREELFRIGQFILIHRENISQIAEELKLQQSGLVDETQTVRIGKWLAANESVTGRLDALGNSYLLFAKRTDIQSLSTLGMGSLKCAAGKEEELLNGMPALAKKLAGLTQP